MIRFELSATRLGMDLHVPANRISEIVAGRRDVTPDTALRLSQYLGTSRGFWTNLQSAHDLSKAAAEKGSSIEKEVRPRETA